MSESSSGRGALGSIGRLAARGVGVKIALATAMPLLGLLFLVGLFVASAPGSSAGGQGCKLTATSSKGVPPNYLPWLQRAAVAYQPGPPWLLDHRRDPLRRVGLRPLAAARRRARHQNFAGAEGPGQFLAPNLGGLRHRCRRRRSQGHLRRPRLGLRHRQLLHASGAPEDWTGAIFAYNHAQWYVEEVEAKAAKIGGGQVVCAPQAGTVAGGSADLRHVETLYRAAGVQGDSVPLLGRRRRQPEAVDSRIWPDLIWVLQSFDLRAVAARETGHQTHGDGTAVDLVPATGRGWDQTARTAAETLGWREGCGASGTAPICPLVPAIQFIGYNGYPGHGDPAHAGANAHLHISWQRIELRLLRALPAAAMGQGLSAFWLGRRPTCRHPALGA